MKTHNISFLSALLALALALVAPAMAETAFTETSPIAVDTRDNYGDFAYIDYGTTITITGYTFKAAKTIDIPAFIGGKPVTSIAPNAFQGFTSLQTVTIPAGITSIGSNAFLGSSGLSKAVFVGNAPTTVGIGPFDFTAPTFKVLYNGSATGFSSPTWRGYPSQALVPSADVFAGLELTCRDRAGIMDIVFDHLPTTLNTSPGVGDVRALYSLDGGTSWRPLRAATGDLGNNVPAGLGLVIKWDYDADGILTDPAYGTQIAIQLISTTPPGISEASTPAPNRVPVRPVQVNFCFGHAAESSVKVENSILVQDSAPSPPSSAFDLRQEEIRAETEMIYRRAGVTAESMTFVIGPPQQVELGKKMINVFFTPDVGNRCGVCITYDDALKDMVGSDRFGNKSPLALVLIATNRSNDEEIQAWYNRPKNVAENVAHEVGHGLGLYHIEKQPTSYLCIMDYTYGFDSSSGPFLACFSHEPLLTTSDASGKTPNLRAEKENEMYHLLRWVEGIRSPYLLTPGEYDLEAFAFSETPSEVTLAGISLGGAPTLYNVRVLSIRSDGEVGTPVREFPILTAQQLLDFQLETGGAIRIIASSTPGGEADVEIIPQAQTTPIQFTPVQGQAMKVLKYDAQGIATNIGSGATQSVTTSPIMPKDISVKPTGFDGAHVQVEFVCEPGYQYTLKRSDDCNTWTPVPALTNIPGSNEGRLSLLDENAGQEKKKLFYRVKVNMPTTP